jgi:uncharacterized protein YjdB
MATQVPQEVTMPAIMLLRIVAVLATVGVTAACNDSFSVPPNDPSTGTLTVVPRSATIAAGQVAVFKATLKDEFGDQIATNMRWTSSDDAIATVSSSGEVFGRSVGRAVITADALGKAQTSVVQVVARGQKKDSGVVQ